MADATPPARLGGTGIGSASGRTFRASSIRSRARDAEREAAEAQARADAEADEVEPAPAG